MGRGYQLQSVLELYILTTADRPGFGTVVGPDAVILGIVIVAVAVFVLLFLIIVIISLVLVRVKKKSKLVGKGVNYYSA